MRCVFENRSQSNRAMPSSHEPSSCSRRGNEADGTATSEIRLLTSAATVQVLPLLASLLVLLASGLSGYSATPTTRAVRVLNAIAQPGANVTVILEMDTLGDENALGF